MPPVAHEHVCRRDLLHEYAQGVLFGEVGADGDRLVERIQNSVAFVLGFLVRLEFKAFRRALDCRRNGVVAVNGGAVREYVFDGLAGGLGYVVHEVDLIARNRIERLFGNIAVLVGGYLRREFRRDNADRGLSFFDMPALVVPSVHSVDAGRLRVLHENEHLIAQTVPAEIRHRVDKLRVAAVFHPCEELFVRCRDHIVGVEFQFLFVLHNRFSPNKFLRNDCFHGVRPRGSRRERRPHKRHS